MKAPRIPIARTGCPDCGADLWHMAGEPVCPDCTRYTADPPPLFVATDCGEYVESDYDLERLLRVLREEIMDPGSDSDVVVTAFHRVVAVIKGDTLAVVRVR
jgi:hypothetical protein